jgi:hypothetical protein|tara:strand:- start:762 stop:1769 length:1008 start_codon:yes stop_codon:yes gene_type:complete
MAIPAQVKKQSEAVQKLYDELNSEVTEQDTPSEAVVENIKPVAVEEANSVDEQAAEPTDKEQAQVGDGDEEAFEKRYKSLQGMYNAEVPRLHAEKRELESRVSQLESLMTSLGTPNQTPTTASQPLVTDADVEEYGESIDVMRRVSREEAAQQQSRIDQLENLVRGMQTSVVPQVQQLQHRQAVTTEQVFWADIQNAVPDWQDVNVDPDFQSWLLDVDPLTGISRQTYLDDAQRNLDARRVTNFFATWKAQTGQSVAQPSRKADATSQLEKQVSPGRGRSGSTQGSSEPMTYTANDIKTFFSDVQRGKFKGKEQERDRKERDIFAAQREGRIVTA